MGGTITNGGTLETIVINGGTLGKHYYSYYWGHFEALLLMGLFELLLMVALWGEHPGIITFGDTITMEVQPATME